MLPHQSPLYNAFDALEAKDLNKAEDEIRRFFGALETDPIAAEIRRQHFERQVFEADFVSVLTKEEIDAWCVLSAIKLERNDPRGACADCYRQIELIDQHYGFKTPSWQRPEARVPYDQELVERYFRLASHLATVYEKLNDSQMSQRWINAGNTAASNRTEPDQVWERWIAEDGHDGRPAGLSSYQFTDWSIGKIDIDGKNWLVNLYRMLPDRASPQTFKTLVSIHIPTETAADVPTKDVRWRIWSLRQAIAHCFERSSTGIFFGELQGRGERILLYYATSESAAQTAVSEILAAAAELSPQLAVREDLGWKEYTKWGGCSISLAAPDAVPVPKAKNDNDFFLREAWQSAESINNVWSKLYILLWVTNLVPPQTDAVREYCVEFFFSLLDLMNTKERENALLHMVWKLPNIDPVAAVRAFDMVWVEPLPLQHASTINLAAEELAEVDPERALLMVEALKMVQYTLIHKVAGKIAARLAQENVTQAKAVIAQTRDYIVSITKEAFAKVSYLAELAGIIADAFPDIARELLLEAASLAPDMDDDRMSRTQIYLALARMTKKAAADLLPSICPAALESAYALAAPSAPSDDWMDFASPRIGIHHISWFIPCLSAYNKAMALEVLTQATDMTCELDDSFDQLDLLPALAQAAGCLDIETNRGLAQRLWNILNSKSRECASPGTSFLNNRRLPGLPAPCEAFVRMNLPLAVERLASIKAICELAVLPETQVDLLCSFAEAMSDQPKCSERLILEAVACCRKCSSDFLRAVALAQVAVAMHALNLDTNDACKAVIDTIDSIGSPETRLGALLDSAQKCSSSYPDFAGHLLEQALPLTAVINDGVQGLLEQLNGIPHRFSARLFFELIRKRKDDNRFSEMLSRCAENFARVNGSSAGSGADADVRSNLLL